MLGFVRKCVRFALMAAVIISVTHAVPMFAVSFRSEWKAATAGALPTNGILGAWEGVWKSQTHGVSGPLRCVIRYLGDGQYQAYFHAQFHWFRFSYVAKMTGEKSGDGLKLTGDANLGWMGGVYHYSGYASDRKFTSAYKSNVEHGVLELSRPRS